MQTDDIRQNPLRNVSAFMFKDFHRDIFCPQEHSCKEDFHQCHGYLIRFHLTLTELGVCLTFFKRLNSLVVSLSTAFSVVFHFWVMRGKTDSGVFDVSKRFL